VAALEQCGGVLSVRLVVDAPAGALTPAPREALAEHRPDLLVRLAREEQWKVLSAERWGDAVGDPEPGIDNPGRRPALETLAAALDGTEPDLAGVPADLRFQ